MKTNNFKNLKKKIFDFLFEDEEIDMLIKNASLKKEKADASKKHGAKHMKDSQNKQEGIDSETKSAEVKEIKKNIEEKKETVITPVKVKKDIKTKSKSIFTEEKYEKRDIISPIFGNLSRPMPNVKTIIKSNADKPAKVLSPIFGIQTSKSEEVKEKTANTDVKKLELVQQN